MGGSAASVRVLMLVSWETLLVSSGGRSSERSLVFCVSLLVVTPDFVPKSLTRIKQVLYRCLTALGLRPVSPFANRLIAPMALMALAVLSLTWRKLSVLSNHMSTHLTASSCRTVGEGHLFVFGDGAAAGDM